jgi:hypothetical protein
MTRLEAIPLWVDTALGDDEVLTSVPIACKWGDPEHLMFRVTSVSGTANVKIQFLVSNDGTTFNTATSQDALVASTLLTFAAPLNPEDYHVLTCPAAPWIKIVVTEISAGSLTDTRLDATLWMRNDVSEIR